MLRAGSVCLVGCYQCARQRLCRSGRAVLAHNHVGPLTCQRMANRLADAARPTRDKCDLTREGQ